MSFPFLLVWQCCQALAAAVCSTNEPPKCIVPRILFLDSYFCSEDKSEWNWSSGLKMHVMGSLILQEIFKFHRVCCISSIFVRGSSIFNIFHPSKRIDFPGFMFGRFIY